ncbi:MAG: cell wall-binding repeat-containing protein [Coriobacteriia bacterium]|nr:cell wall-binding repeat-containing protein [Coriobacteriia bacterium]MBN2823543.1 cell wall-binding repeat-containing protein [Coriobacteriia bacterium]
MSVDATRVSGATRYDTAAAIAQASYPGWADVSNVVIASGLDKSLADPLAAGGLCWAYDAPILLVEDTSVPASTKAALEAFVSANTTVTVTVVGGTRSVSQSCVSALEAIVGEGQVLRPFAGVDRFDTAALIAAEVSRVASSTPSLEMPDVVLVANGLDGQFDALALSAISARIGAPVLFATLSSVPAQTSAALKALTPGEIIVAGGTAVVSSKTYDALGASERWAGSNRYGTAAVVAERAIGRDWLEGSSFGVAAALPDALTGSVLCAKSGMPLLYTSHTRVSAELARFVEKRESQMSSCTVFGGTAVISADTVKQLEGAPARPVLNAPRSTLTAKYARVTVTTGVNTSECRLYAGDKLVATKAANSYGTVDFGRVAMPASGEKLRVEAGNPEDGLASASMTIRRLSYPASTCIVVDKSDFRLYWVKSDELISSYPVAIGRVGMETPVAMWQILAKYQTDPASVYGPRKMRMFRQYGSSFVYTAYAIHGTNEPWVIGTKASHGCIRMYNSDVLKLYPQVPIGTLVQTRL